MAFKFEANLQISIELAGHLNYGKNYVFCKKEIAQTSEVEEIQSSLFLAPQTANLLHPTLKLFNIFKRFKQYQ